MTESEHLMQNTATYSSNTACGRTLDSRHLLSKDKLVSLIFLSSAPGLLLVAHFSYMLKRSASTLTSFGPHNKGFLTIQNFININQPLGGRFTSS